MITVIVAHEHRLVRQALSKILSLQNHVLVVGDAASGSDAIEKAEKLCPDVVIVNSALPGLNLPGLNGMSPAESSGQKKKPEVVVFPRRRSIADGDAISHLTYNDNIAALIEAVLEAGGVNASDIGDDLKCRKAIDDLTKREKQVLSLLAEGLSNKLIAHRMTITERTVKYHISNILRKLDLFSRTEAVVAFLRSDLASSQ